MLFSGVVNVGNLIDVVGKCAETGIVPIMDGQQH